MPPLVVVTSAPKVSSGSASTTVSTDQRCSQRGGEAATGIVATDAMCFVIAIYPARAASVSERWRLTRSLTLAALTASMRHRRELGLVLGAELLSLRQVVAVAVEVAVFIGAPVHHRLNCEVTVRP